MSASTRQPSSETQQESSASTSTARETSAQPSQTDEDEQPPAQAPSTLRRSLALPPGPRTSSGSSALKPIAVSSSSSQQPPSRIMLRADPNLKTCFKKEDDAELYQLWAAGK